MPSSPKDPITPLMEGTTQQHELFMAYIASGFTRKEALYLIGQILTAVVKAQASGND
jgi:hypothetical protein